MQIWQAGMAMVWPIIAQNKVAVKSLLVNDDNGCAKTEILQCVCNKIMGKIWKWDMYFCSEHSKWCNVSAKLMMSMIFTTESTSMQKKRVLSEAINKMCLKFY